MTCCFSRPFSQESTTCFDNKDTNLPSTLEYFYVHCGTNNIGSSSPEDIADGILSIGIKAKKTNKNSYKLLLVGCFHAIKRWQQDQSLTR